MANVFNLTALITLDDASFKSGLKGVGRVLGGFGKVVGTALGAASAGVAVLTKKSVSAYAEYEQLVGGVQKLYGNMGMALEDYANSQGKSIDNVADAWANLEEAQNAVLQNAKNAYKTAGMDMNTYMNTATQFSASLISSLGGDSVEAARITDVAMRAISDNWNTFGGDMEAISNAYKGFSKQNYNMLDNLKLGYGGTRKEMQRLISDANEYAKTLGLAGDLSIESFADIIKAIDLVQQKQNIAGTTAREAATTISGSLNMLKAAWSNLLIGISDKNADLSKLMNNLVDSLVGYVDDAGEHINGFLDNLLPVVGNAIRGIGEVITTIVPVIGQKLPALISDTLPGLIGAGASLISALMTGIATAIPTIVAMIPQIISEIKEALINAGPQLAEAGSQIMGMLSEGMQNAFGNLFAAFSSLGDAIVEAIGKSEGLAEGFSASEAAGSALESIINGVASVISFLAENFNEVITVVEVVAGAFVALQAAMAIGSIISGVASAFTFLASPMGLIVVAIVGLIAAGVALYQNWDTIKAKAAEIGASISAAWNAMVGAIVGAWESAKAATISVWSNIKSSVSNAVNSVKSAISSGFSAARGVVSSVWSGIQSTISSTMTTVKSKVQSAINSIKSIVKFSWSLPHLKLPHFSISGSFSLNPPSVPKLSVSWNRKALNEPFMFTEATLFGAGEAGDEVLYGKSNLLDDIRTASSEGNAAMIAKMDAIIAAIEDVTGRPLVLDSGALVGNISTKMDNQLGRLDGYGRRGLSFA